MSTERPTEERGYTLVEFAIAMSVFAILMSIVTPLMFSQIRSGLDTQERIDLSQNARTALRTMVRELRQASELYAGTVDHPTASDRLSFGIDYDGDGVINTGAGSQERLVYYEKPGQDALYRGPKYNAGSPLAENLDTVIFTMFGSNLALDADSDGVVEESELNPSGGWTTSELANVTRIAISLTVASDDQDQTYEAEAFLRNKVVN
jgi:prepilin-type N-terminal cleavage/methylation domain-containing protein